MKFLFAAKCFGPEVMGIVGLLLILYAIVESLSEFGLIGAIVQAERYPSESDLDSIWLALTLRGVVIGIIVFSIPTLTNYVTNTSETLVSALCLAVCALSKSMVSPNWYIALRERNFKEIFFITFLGVSFDFLIFVGLILLDVKFVAIFISLAAGEIIKLILTYLLFGTDRKLFIRFKSFNIDIKKYSNFGKWIWLNNIINLLLNQSDKLITGLILGNASLGIYHMSNRLAQLGISEFSMAYSKYLFPSFSRMNEKDVNNMTRFMTKSLSQISLLAFSSVIYMFSISSLLPILLGEEWKDGIIVLKILSITMAIGSLISVMVVYHRALGNPKLVTSAATIQLIIFIPVLLALTYLYGVHGAASSTVISTAICFVFLIKNVPFDYSVLFSVYRSCLVPFIFFIIVVLISDVFDGYIIKTAISTFGFLIMLFSLVLGSRASETFYKFCRR
ncbi:oligosaccharide flippase family protein [Agarivorans sp. TSD2052]|nr:oligosaccharide flippase family protein [Agarivorans sp. TSD2052]